MEYRQLGRSGLQVSEVGLGTNNFGRSDRPPFHIRAAGAQKVVDEAGEGPEQPRVPHLLHGAHRVCMWPPLSRRPVSTVNGIALARSSSCACLVGSDRR